MKFGVPLAKAAARLNARLNTEVVLVSDTRNALFQTLLPARWIPALIRFLRELINERVNSVLGTVSPGPDHCPLSVLV